MSEAQAGLDRAALQERVGAWHTARFPDARIEHVTMKLFEEGGELASAVNALLDRNSSRHTGTGGGDVLAEAADVVICAMVIAERWVDGGDVLGAVERKLAVLTDPDSGHRSALRQLGGDHGFPVVETEDVPEGTALLIGVDAFDPPPGDDPDRWMEARIVQIRNIGGGPDGADHG